MSGEQVCRLTHEVLALRDELAAVRAKLDEIVGYQLGGPCAEHGAVESVLQVAERVSLGVTRLNADARRYHDERGEARALVAECMAALVAVVPSVNWALREKFAADVAALVEKVCR
jgi:hypothetical protein